MHNKTNLQNWFYWFTEWVKDFVHKIKNPAECKLVVIESLTSRDDLCIARSIIRPTPGSVATWYITHQLHPNMHIIVALDNIYELKKFLEEPLPTDTTHIVRTHLVSVQWLLKIGTKNRKRKIYKFKGAWLADLQGCSDSINAKAGDVIRYLVLEILNLPAISGISWVNRLDKYVWEDAIASKCGIIADNHKPHLKRVKKTDVIGEKRKNE